MISSGASFRVSSSISVGCISCVNRNSARGRLLINCNFYIWVRQRSTEEHILYEFDTVYK